MTPTTGRPLAPAASAYNEIASRHMPLQADQTPQPIYREFTSLGFWGTTRVTSGPTVMGECPVCHAPESCFDTGNLFHKIRFPVLPVGHSRNPLPPALTVRFSSAYTTSTWNSWQQSTRHDW